MKQIKKIILKILFLFKKEEIPLDIKNNKEFIEIYNQCKKYTMTSIERMYTLYNWVKHIIDNKIEWDFVECWVWKWWSSMIIALTLKQLWINNRKIYLYDTFEWMSEPTDNDFDIIWRVAKEELKIKDKDENIWCYSPIEEVKNNLFSTWYPKENIIFIKWKVEDTIPETIPDKISLLRLDTDWYESTKHEMIHLFPILEKNWILIIDDFWHWEGSKKAILEYFKNNNLNYFINRIDNTWVLIQK